MQWWNDLVEWLSSDRRVAPSSPSAIIPFVAIVVAGVVAALIGRGATRRVVSSHESEVEGARPSRRSSRRPARRPSEPSLGTEERAYADHLAHEADVRLRLLPARAPPRRRLGGTRARRHQAQLGDLQLPGRADARRLPRPPRRVAEPPGRGEEAVPRRSRPLEVRRGRRRPSTAAKQKPGRPSSAPRRRPSSDAPRPPRPRCAPSAALRPAALDAAPVRGGDEAYRAPTAPAPLAGRRRCPRPRHRPSRRVTRPTTTPVTTRWTTSATSSRSVRARSAAARHPNARTTDHLDDSAPPTSVGARRRVRGVGCWRGAPGSQRRSTQ